MNWLERKWYRLTQKYKIFDWVDENVVWYLYDKPMDWYKTVRCWYYCDAKNPYHWKLVWNTTFYNRPWATCYLYETMQLQILKMKYYFEHTTMFISDNHKNEAIKWMNLAIRMINIINENDDLWDYDYEDPEKKTHEERYSCKVYVNLRNKERFTILGTDWENPDKKVKCVDYFENEPHELYKRKAEHLLMKIIYEHGQDWWD